MKIEYPVADRALFNVLTGSIDENMVPLPYKIYENGLPIPEDKRRGPRPLESFQVRKKKKKKKS